MNTSSESTGPAAPETKTETPNFLDLGNTAILPHERLQLLRDTLAQPTQSKVSAFVQTALGFMGRTFTIDPKGNIYSDPDPTVRKPWFVGHMDTVHREHVDDQPLHIHEVNGWLMALWNGCFGKNAPRQTGIGGDDKCGVWAALEAARNEMYGGTPVGLFFPVDEEIGCLGTKAALESPATKALFASASCFIQLDRRNYGDAIEHTNGVKVWSPKFRELLTNIMPLHKMSAAHGTCTDIGVLSPALKVPAINIGSGYHDAHSAFETVNIEEAMRALNFALHLADIVSGIDSLGELEPTVSTPYAPYNPHSAPNYGGYLSHSYRSYDDADPDFWPEEYFKSSLGKTKDKQPISLFPKKKGKKAEGKKAGGKKRPADGWFGTAFESACFNLECWLGERLMYPMDWVKVDTSPKGVAVYMDRDGCYSWPESGGFDCNGFATDHATRIANGGTCLDGKRAFRVTLRGKTGSDWILSRLEDGLLKADGEDGDMDGYIEGLIRAFGDNLVKPVFTSLGTAKGTGVTTPVANLTKVDFAPMWSGCSAARPVYIAPTDFFALKRNSAATLTLDTVVFVELMTPRGTKMNSASRKVSEVDATDGYAAVIAALKATLNLPTDGQS